METGTEVSKGRTSVDAETALRCIERNRMSGVWAEFVCVYVCVCVCVCVCVRIWKTGNCYEHGNETSSSMKCGECRVILFPGVSR